MRWEGPLTPIGIFHVLIKGYDYDCTQDLQGCYQAYVLNRPGQPSVCRSNLRSHETVQALNIHILINHIGRLLRDSIQCGLRVAPYGTGSTFGSAIRNPSTP